MLAAGWTVNNYLDYVGRVYAAGAKDCWDHANVHFYSGTGLAFGANSYLARVFSDIRALRTQYGDSDPLWITETGFKTGGQDAVSETDQCDGSRRLYNRLITMGEVTGVVFHTLRDKSDSGEQPGDWAYYFGFLRDDWTPKPVYLQFQSQAGNGGSSCPT